MAERTIQPSNARVITNPNRVLFHVNISCRSGFILNGGNLGQEALNLQGFEATLMQNPWQY
ncbi:MAG: hypothetical protein ACO3GL_02165 [Bacteroidia bacterium]